MEWGGVETGGGGGGGGAHAAQQQMWLRRRKQPTHGGGCVYLPARIQRRGKHKHAASEEGGLMNAFVY